MRKIGRLAVLLVLVQIPGYSQGWFGGLERRTAEPTGGDWFSSSSSVPRTRLNTAPILQDSSAEEMHILGEWRELKNYHFSRNPLNSDELLRDLQSLVNESRGSNPRAMLAYSRALTTFARKPYYQDQMTGMLRMAGIYLDYVAVGGGSATEAQKEEALRLQEALGEEAGLESTSEETREQVQAQEGAALSEADALIAEGRYEEAEARIRYAAHLSRFTNQTVLRKLRDVLREMARREARPERASVITAEANFIDRTLGEDEAADAIVSGNPTGQENAPASNASQEQVEVAVERAHVQEQNGEHTEALETLREIVIESGFRSAKARYYLARQYLRMASMSEFRSRRTEYERLGNTHLAEARQLAGRHLDTYPDNAQFAEEAERLGEEGMAAAPSRPLEDAVDNAIREALSLNEENRLSDALRLLREAVEDSSRHSSKAFYFLGKQYVLLVRSGRDVTANRSRARQAYEAAIALESSHLEDFSQNREWAGHARDRLAELDVTPAPVSTEPSESAPDETPSQPARQMLVKAASGLNLRRTPEGQVLRTLEYGTVVEVRSQRNGWSQVRVNGQEGWVSTEWLEEATAQRIASRAQEMIAPCNGTVTSVYGMRTHPIHGTRRMHAGLDVGAPKGTPLKAMANGEIIYVGTMGGYGKTVKIRYDNGYESLYAHMHNYSGTRGTSRVGQRVVQGEVVGQVNTTGSSTGNHLHLELRRNGERISPAPVIGKRNTRGERI